MFDKTDATFDGANRKKAQRLNCLAGNQSGHTGEKEKLLNDNEQELVKNLQAIEEHGGSFRHGILTDVSHDESGWVFEQPGHLNQVSQYRFKRPKILKISYGVTKIEYDGQCVEVATLAEWHDNPNKFIPHAVESTVNDVVGTTVIWRAK